MSYADMLEAATNTVTYGGEDIDASLFKRGAAMLRKGGGSVTVKGLKKRTFNKMARAGLVTAKKGSGGQVTYTLTTKGKKALRESLEESDSFSAISTPASWSGPTGGGAGDAGPAGDTPGMATNSQSSAQAAATAEAGRVFAGLYGAKPGQKLSIRGQDYTVSTGIQRSSQRDWLTITGPKGNQFVLMMPAKGPNGELNAPWLTVMASGRARTDPFEIKVQDLMKENEDLLGDDDGVGFDRLDAIQESKEKVNVREFRNRIDHLNRVVRYDYSMAADQKELMNWLRIAKRVADEVRNTVTARANATDKKRRDDALAKADELIKKVESGKVKRERKTRHEALDQGADVIVEADMMKWMQSVHGSGDLKMGKSYIPAASVLGNRERGRQKEEIDAIGERLFGRQYASEWTGNKELWVTYRDNRDDEEWKQKMKKLESAVKRAGYRTKWSKRSMYVLFDQKRIKAASDIHDEYVSWLKGKRGQTESMEESMDIDSLRANLLEGDLLSEG